MCSHFADIKLHCLGRYAIGKADCKSSSKYPTVTAILLLLNRNNLNASKIGLSNKINYLIFYFTINDAMVKTVINSLCHLHTPPKLRTPSVFPQCAKSE